MNTLHPADRLTPLDYAPLSARIEAYRLGEPKDLRGPLFLTALALLVIDALVVFWLAGGLYRLMPRRRMVTGALLLGVIAGRTARLAGVGAGARSRTRASGRHVAAPIHQRPGRQRRARSRRRRSSPRRSRPTRASPTSSPATARSTTSARPALRASPCSWRSAPRSRPASRSGSTRRATSSRSSR